MGIMCYWGGPRLLYHLGRYIIQYHATHSKYTLKLVSGNCNKAIASGPKEELAVIRKPVKVRVDSVHVLLLTRDIINTKV